jgi:hypothetical protein
MIDYEVYGYPSHDPTVFGQELEICYSYREAVKSAAAMKKKGLTDVRIVKHDVDDESTAFWEYRNNKLTRVE